MEAFLLSFLVTLRNMMKVLRFVQVPTDENGRYLSTTLPNSGYERSDSMPAASVRLALEEKRRDLEKKRLFERWAVTFLFVH